MAWPGYVLCAVILGFCFAAELEGVSLILKPDSTSTTYVKKGKSLTLNVTYDYNGKDVVEVSWKGNDQKLCRKYNPGVEKQFDPRASIKGNASLVLVNTTLKDNGTYQVRAEADDLSTEPTEEFIVVIQVKSIANVTCPIVNITEGENLTCICSGVGGSPPPTAYWLKDNNVRAMGYRSALLDIRNISKKDTGAYICRVKSGTLTDEQPVDITVFDKPVANVTCKTSESIKEGENFSCTCSGNDGSPPPSVMWLKDNNKLITVDNILKLSNISKLNNGAYVCRVQSGNLWEEEQVDVTVLYKATMVSFTSNASEDNAKRGDNVKLTCVATDGYPKPTYRITFKGKNVSTTGVLIIENADSNDIGTYTCFAINTAGSKEKSLDLNVTETGGKTTAPSTTPVPSTTPTNSTKSSGAPLSDKKESNIAPFVGGAIGGLVFLIICIVLIWYCCCKRSASGSCKGGNGGGEDIVVNPANPSYAAMGDSMDRGNAYESVDQAKVDQARDDESGPSNENPPDAGNSLPPVYAVVNKSKKAPKPPPEKQPDSLTYASLDPVVLQPDSSKTRDRTREETNYASIDLLKLKKDQE